MKMRYRLLTTAVILTLAGCGRAPNGQVIATVNGEEITRSELNAALAGRPPGTGKTLQETRNAALDALVTRALFVQEARRRGIDKSQTYLLAIHDAEDRILSDLLARKLMSDTRMPDSTALDGFIRDNPTRFAGRTLLTLDQVRYPAGARQVSLEDAHSLEEVVRRLSAAGVHVVRQRAEIDSASIPPALFRKITGMPADEPFIIIEGDAATASVIVDRKLVPVGGEAAVKLAVQVVRQQEMQATVEDRVKMLRQDAKIRYQPGFGPIKAPPPPT